MKNTFFFFITIIISAVIIIGSYFIWSAKVNNASTDTNQTSTTDEKKEKKKSAANDEENDDAEDKAVAKGPVLSERHEGIYDHLVSRIDADEPVRILMIGSKRTVSDNLHLAQVFEERLREQLGDLLELDEITMMDDSIFSFYNSDTYASHKEKAYDFVIIEPFMLNNQGVLSYEDTENYLSEIFNDWSDDTLIIVQPSAKVAVEYIETRHNHLVEFMADKPQVFIDAWAEIAEDESIADYVGDGGSPNDDGIELWAHVLASYFVE